ncbi:MAG: MAPEG family protein [Cyanobacteria bacterium P01_C01_bin.69]
MTIDLICLLILALWSIPLNHIPALGRVSQGGLAWGASNREKSIEGPAWVGRADRAQRNHHDNLAMIAAVILMAQVTGQADGVTANGAIAVLAFRVVHGVAYIAGVPLVRSLAYLGSIIGLGVIVWRILL